MSDPVHPPPTKSSHPSTSPFNPHRSISPNLSIEKKSISPFNHLLHNLNTLTSTSSVSTVNNNNNINNPRPSTSNLISIVSIDINKPLSLISKKRPTTTNGSNHNNNNHAFSPINSVYATFNNNLIITNNRSESPNKKFDFSNSNININHNNNNNNSPINSLSDFLDSTIIPSNDDEPIAYNNALHSPKRSYSSTKFKWPGAGVSLLEKLDILEKYDVSERNKLLYGNNNNISTSNAKQKLNILNTKEDDILEDCINVASFDIPNYPVLLSPISEPFVKILPPSKPDPTAPNWETLNKLSSPSNKNHRPRTVNNDSKIIKSSESPKVDKSLNLSSGFSNLYKSVDNKNDGLFNFLPKEISNLLTKNRASPTDNIFKNPNLIINPNEKNDGGSGPNSPNVAWSRKPSIVTFAVPSTSELLLNENGKDLLKVDDSILNSEHSKSILPIKDVSVVPNETSPPVIANIDMNLDLTLKSPVLNLNSIDIYAKTPVTIAKPHSEKFEPDSSELHIGIPKPTLKSEFLKKGINPEISAKPSKGKPKTLNPKIDKIFTVASLDPSPPSQEVINPVKSNVKKIKKENEEIVLDQQNNSIETSPIKTLVNNENVPLSNFLDPNFKLENFINSFGEAENKETSNKLKKKSKHGEKSDDPNVIRIPFLASEDILYESDIETALESVGTGYTLDRTLSNQLSEMVPLESEELTPRNAEDIFSDEIEQYNKKAEIYDSDQIEQYKKETESYDDDNSEYFENQRFTSANSIYDDTVSASAEQNDAADLLALSDVYNVSIASFRESFNEISDGIDNADQSADIFDDSLLESYREDEEEASNNLEETNLNIVEEPIAFENPNVVYDEQIDEGCVLVDNELESSKIEEFDSNIRATDDNLEHILKKEDILNDNEIEIASNNSNSLFEAEIVQTLPEINDSLIEVLDIVSDEVIAIDTNVDNYPIVFTEPCNEAFIEFQEIPEIDIEEVKEVVEDNLHVLTIAEPSENLKDDTTLQDVAKVEERNDVIEDPIIVTEPVADYEHATNSTSVLTSENNTDLIDDIESEEDCDEENEIDILEDEDGKEKNEIDILKDEEDEEKNEIDILEDEDDKGENEDENVLNLKKIVSNFELESEFEKTSIETVLETTNPSSINVQTLDIPKAENIAEDSDHESEHQTAITARSISPFEDVQPVVFKSNFINEEEETVSMNSDSVTLEIVNQVLPSKDVTVLPEIINAPPILNFPASLKTINDRPLPSPTKISKEMEKRNQSTTSAYNKNKIYFSPNIKNQAATLEKFFNLWRIGYEVPPSLRNIPHLQQFFERCLLDPLQNMSFEQFTEWHNKNSETKLHYEWVNNWIDSQGNLDDEDKLSRQLILTDSNLLNKQKPNNRQFLNPIKSAKKVFDTKKYDSSTNNVLTETSILSKQNSGTNTGIICDDLKNLTTSKSVGSFFLPPIKTAVDDKSLPKLKTKTLSTSSSTSSLSRSFTTISASKAFTSNKKSSFLKLPKLNDPLEEELDDSITSNEFMDTVLERRNFFLGNKKDVLPVINK